MSTATLKARLAKLEASRQRPSRLRNHVVTLDPDGNVIGRLTKRRPIMLQTCFGTDEEWETKLLAQQEKLVGHAIIETQAPQSH